MELIRLIIRTLNQIEVKGAENMDRLLGAIQGLEKLDKAMEAQHENNNEQEQDVSGKVD